MASTTQSPQPVYPAIPPATDLKSAIAAINALASAFRILAQVGPGSTGVTKTGQ